MLQVINPAHDPYFNLALEEYFLTKGEADDDYFILWQNSPAVIVGRNQNTWDEINLEYIKSNDIAVVRRSTGGGAVYHDLGNLNFSFIFHKQQEKNIDFARFMMPVVDILKGMGLAAAIDGRNDISIDGKKISGNAQYHNRDRVLHHGTLLFNVNLERMTEALKVSSDKIASKGVASVRSRVTNIKKHLSDQMDLAQFTEAVSMAIFDRFNDSQRSYYVLTIDDQRQINKLKVERYGTWEWNFGASPDYALKKSRRFDWGKLELLLDVHKGMIVKCKICGDFFANRDLDMLEALLTNIPYRETAIRQVLRQVNLSDFIGGLDEANLVNLLTQ